MSGYCLVSGCYGPKRALNLCNKHYLELYFSQQPRSEYERGRKHYRRTSLALEVSQITGIPIKKCYKIINIILSTIKEGLKRGEQVYIPGFGIFDTHNRPVQGWGLSPYFRPAKELRWMVRHPDYNKD